MAPGMQKPSPPGKEKKKTPSTIPTTPFSASANKFGEPIRGSRPTRHWKVRKPQSGDPGKSPRKLARCFWENWKSQVQFWARQAAEIENIMGPRACLIPMPSTMIFESFFPPSHYHPPRKISPHQAQKLTRPSPPLNNAAKEPGPTGVSITKKGTQPRLRFFFVRSRKIARSRWGGFGNFGRPLPTVPFSTRLFV